MEESKKENDSSHQKKKIAGIVFATLLVAGAITIFFYLSYKATHISTDDAFVDGRAYTIAPKISGTIKAVHIVDNQMVRKGDLLLEIDPADYDAKMKEAASSADSEEAKVLEYQAKVKAARAHLELQEANLRQAELDIRRAETLFGKDAISKERFEKTQTSYDVTRAELNAAREQLRQSESSIAAQSAVVLEKKAKLQSAKLNLGYTNIFAPADGFVTKRSAEKGNQVQPGQPLLAVVALDDIWVTANYKETQLKKIRPGQKVEIKVDTFSGVTFAGKVDSVMAGTGAVFSLFPPENATGNYVKVVQRIPVKIVLDKDRKDNLSQVLRVGMSVVPTVIVE